MPGPERPGRKARTMNRRIERLENAIRAIERGNGAAGPTAVDQAVIDAYRRDIAALRPTDTPAQIARAAIASYREFSERYGQSPDEATEAAVREVTEGLVVDVAAVRAEVATHPGPTAAEMEWWPL